MGHIMRDLVLAKQFQEENIIFACLELDGNLIDQIPYPVEILKSNDIEELDQLIKKLQIDMIVIDHYDIDYEFEKQLKIQNSKLKIFVLDDTYERHYCDILLNHNISADTKKYEGLVPDDCELRCGEKFTLLREEFYYEKKIKREKIYDIFIALGGADTQNVNLQLLKLLPHYFKIAVVTTSANKNLENLQLYVKERASVDLYVDSNQIAKLMHESKFAIVTPSVTVHEVLFMELPFLAIKTAENQEDIFTYLLKHGYSALESFQPNKIQKMAIELKNFIDLSYDEKVEILSWRNHPSVRKWMFDKEPITLKNHIAYIDALREKKDSVYLVVRQYGQAVGVIDFTHIDFNHLTAEIGLYAKPTLKGVGRLLMQNIFVYGFEKLKLKRLVAKVFEENFAARRLYEKFGFKQIDRQGTLIIMEKRDENR